MTSRNYDPIEYSDRKLETFATERLKAETSAAEVFFDLIDATLREHVELILDREYHKVFGILIDRIKGRTYQPMNEGMLFELFMDAVESF